MAGGNRRDLKLALPTLAALRIPRRRRPGEHRGFCADKAYSAKSFRQELRRRGFTAHIPAPGSAPRKRTKRHRARRWVVERTHAWLNAFRGIRTRWCRDDQSYLAFLHVGMAAIIVAQAGL